VEMLGFEPRSIKYPQKILLQLRLSLLKLPKDV